MRATVDIAGNMPRKVRLADYPHRRCRLLTAITTSIKLLLRVPRRPFTVKLLNR